MAGGVDEDLAAEADLGLGGVLMADDGLDPAVFHDHIIHIGVQIGSQIFLITDSLPQDGVKDREAGVGIAALVFQQHFQQNAGLGQVGLGGVGIGTDDMHADFGAGVAAVDTAVLDDGGVDAVTGSCDGGAHTAQTAADDNDIIAFLNQVDRHFSCPPLQQVL